MKVRLAKKQMKKARPYWESQGYKFKRKAKIIRYSLKSLLGDYSTKWIYYCFVNMDGRIQNYFPIRIESKRNRKSRALGSAFFVSSDNALSIIRNHATVLLQEHVTEFLGYTFLHQQLNLGLCQFLQQGFVCRFVFLKH